MLNDLWYKNAIVYCLSVGTFMDANGDGVGDFQGLIRRLDYLQGLGATTIWLMPFQPSPGRDNGYDISDYYNVDPKYGTLGDFAEFSHACRERGLRVMIDLVVNHTSDQHAWFKEARSDPDSKYRDWYVWADKQPSNAKDGVVFPGVQKSTWTYDKLAKRWFFHRFYDFQPDLNTANPHVQAELLKVMGFWIQLGVSGFRMDAVPFVIATKGPKVRKPVEQYDMLRTFREFLQWRKGDAIILAEANVLPDTDLDYFGDDGERLQMMFNFQVNQNTFYTPRDRRYGAFEESADSDETTSRDRSMGCISAQSRRTGSGPSDARPACRRVRHVRPGPRHAAIRARHSPQACADALWRQTPPRARLQPDADLARDAGISLRR
jgi:maltose alpha-D-glucosyltransferase/alpha-amylase